MSIVIKNKLIIEDILNENGQKIGEIKFNPNDSSIMKMLAEILSNLNKAVKELDKYKNIDLKKLTENSTIEEFENASVEIEKVSEAMRLEYETIDNSITELKKIFGEETINCFTSGTHDIETLMPLLEFIMPYVQKNRNEKINKYIKKNDDVME